MFPRIVELSKVWSGEILKNIERLECCQVDVDRIAEGYVEVPLDSCDERFVADDPTADKTAAVTIGGLPFD